MKKLNKKQKEHIKNVLKKTFNIFCYICTGILAILLLIVSLQGCQRVSRTSAESPNYNYSYVLRDKGVVAYEYEDFERWNDIFGLGGNIYSDYHGEDYITFEYGVTQGSQYLDSSATTTALAIRNFTSIRYTFKTYEIVGRPLLYSRLYSIDLQVYPNIYLTLVSNYRAAQGLSEYYLEYSDKDDFIVSDGGFYLIKGVDEFWYNQTIYTFTFNEPFNFNAPLGTTINGVYGNNAHLVGSGEQSITYNLPWFESGGRLFDSITYYVSPSNSRILEFIGSDNSKIYKNGPNGQYVYIEMYYENSETSVSVLVNKRDSLPYIVNSDVEDYLANTTTWATDSYRTLRFLNEPSVDIINTINQFNNNTPSSNGGSYVTGDVSNIFTLIGSAFSGLLPILSTTIIPGITIGVLLFIPLVAMLVFAIIRIIKK